MLIGELSAQPSLSLQELDGGLRYNRHVHTLRKLLSIDLKVKC